MARRHIASLALAVPLMAAASDALAIPCYPPPFIHAPRISIVLGEVVAMKPISHRTQLLWGTDRMIRVVTYRATIRMIEHLKGPRTPAEFSYEFTDKVLGCPNLPVAMGRPFVFIFDPGAPSTPRIEAHDVEEHERRWGSLKELREMYAPRAPLPEPE